MKTVEVGRGQKWVALSREEYNILTYIAEGYKTTGEADYLIVVENPDYNPTNGSSPNCVIDLHEIGTRNGEFDE